MINEGLSFGHWLFCFPHDLAFECRPSQETDAKIQNHILEEFGHRRSDGKLVGHDMVENPWKFFVEGENQNSINECHTTSLSSPWLEWLDVRSRWRWSSRLCKVWSLSGPETARNFFFVAMDQVVKYPDFFRIPSFCLASVEIFWWCLSNSGSVDEHNYTYLYVYKVYKWIYGIQYTMHHIQLQK